MTAELDATMGMASGKLAEASPVKALPWDLIINAVISLFKGCGGNPTPAEARERLANAGPFVSLQLLRKLTQGGMSFRDARDSIHAAKKAAAAATDEEAAQFMAMAQAADVD